MDNFLLEYRDPLFGILIFFTLVFIVSFFSYWWAQYKKREQDTQIDNFFEKLKHSYNGETLDIENDNKKALMLLASAFERSGDFEKAILIYLNLTKHEKSYQQKRELLKKLGFVYFKAGFLEKSREIFLESLRNYPRDKEALKFLMVIYERLQQYDKAKEILESYEELEENKEERYYFEILDILKNKNNKKELLKIYSNSSAHVRMIFEYLFKNEPKVAWKELKSKDYKKLVDIFWKLPKKDIDKEVIKKDRFLSEIYSAKRYLDLANSSEIFELDLLLNLKKDIADLDFEYICTKCKNLFPFAFGRCPNCLVAKSPKVELILTKKREHEKSESFQ